MIREIKINNMVENLFKKYFPTYKIGDVYEKVAIYEDEKIMAMVSYSIIYERAEINYIVTFPEFRQKGIAEKLLEFVITNSVSLKCNSISLEVDINNTSAINLYLKKGFKKKAIRKNYYQGNDAYLMIKELVVSE